MDRAAFQERTEDFTVRVGVMVDALPTTTRGRTFGTQVLRAAGSIGANYCESNHASSKRHFISIMEIVQREADETMYRLRVITRSNLLKPARMGALTKECDELISILTKMILTAKRRNG